MKKNITFLFILLFGLINLTADWKKGEPFTDTRDGQTYKTVVIEQQVWMAENLNIGKMIPTTKSGYEMKEDGIIEKYCWENDSSNCDGTNDKEKLGGFYEWKEAMNYPSGTLAKKDICPEGWRIPNNDDWNELFNNLNGVLAYRYLVVGGSTGFEAKMTGYRCTMTGSFRVSAMSGDKRTYFWSSTPSDAENANLVELGMGSLQSFPFSKSLGLCVRCILDETVDVNDEFEESGLKVSPNPAVSGHIKISLGGLKNPVISIFDVLGNRLLVKDAEGQDEILISTDEFRFSSGRYLVMITDSDRTYVESVLVLR